MSDEKPESPQPPDPRRPAMIGLGIVLALIVGGMILVHLLRNMSKVQDCVMSGRTNCAPIDQPAPSGNGAG
jgi:hypothetical protein